MNIEGFSHDLRIENIRLTGDALEVEMEDELRLRIWRHGLKAGIWLFAVNKNGEQLVGIMKDKIQDAYKLVDEGKYDHLMEVGP